MEEYRDDAKSATTDLPSWDETSALEATGGDAGLARELLDVFVQALPKEISELQRCFQSNDWTMLSEIAHRIRGATSYCGVLALDASLHELERTAKSGDRARIEVLLGQVEQEVERLMRSG